MDDFNYASYQARLTNSCCIPGAYNGFNLLKANPFDPRSIPGQPNQWCSNELILQDKEMRCQARIQPLDVEFDHAVRASAADIKAKGLH